MYKESIIKSIIIFCLGLTCLSGFSVNAPNLNQLYISKLSDLLEEKLSYPQDISGDSIIMWDKTLAFQLDEDENYILYFELKRLVVSVHAMRGDISLATEQARLMYDKAKQLQNKIGIGLSLYAIGETYLEANMLDEATEAFGEAFQQMGTDPDATNIQIRLLPKFAIVLVKSGRLEQAAAYLKTLDKLSSSANQQSNFYVLAAHAFYALQTGDFPATDNYLQQAQQIYEVTPLESYQMVLQYINIHYYKAQGKYKKALSLFDTLEQKTLAFVPNQWLNLAFDKVDLLLKMNLPEETGLLYKKINALQDSLTTQSYQRQINNLHMTYRVDQIELDNQVRRNQMMLYCIISAVIILIVVLVLFWQIRKQNRNLKQSRIKMEETRIKAEKAIRTKSVLLSNMSHEIRTPLNALSGFSDILADENVDDETRKQCSDIIQQNSELLLKLINDVIDLSDIEMGRFQFNMGEDEAVSICRRVIDTVDKIKQTAANISFVTDLPELMLYTDKSRLQQVLINLLINSTKFTSKGSIVLKLEMESEGIALFSVTDTGHGIPLGKQGQIFNRFEKLNEMAQGTGLGLSICQLIIERMGGCIWIDPSYTTGARFFFTHPVKPKTYRKEEKV